MYRMVLHRVSQNRQAKIVSVAWPDDGQHLFNVITSGCICLIMVIDKLSIS